MRARKRTRRYTKRYGRKAISNIGFWRLPKPILKYTYKQSLNLNQDWEFGWNNYDTDFFTLDFNSELIFNDSTTLSKYFAMQYGRWIINKIDIVLDSYDIARYVSDVIQPKGHEPGAVMPDPFFNKSKIYWEYYFPNNRDSFGVPVLGDRYEFIRKCPFGKRFRHSYYPRCKKTIITKVGDMHGKLGDALTKMASPDGGRSIGYVGFGPLTNLPIKNDENDYVKYSISMSFSYYIHMTFSDRNIQMMT